MNRVRPFSILLTFPNSFNHVYMPYTEATSHEVTCVKRCKCVHRFNFKVAIFDSYDYQMLNINSYSLFRLLKIPEIYGCAIDFTVQCDK